MGCENPGIVQAFKRPPLTSTIKANGIACRLIADIVVKAFGITFDLRLANKRTALTLPEDGLQRRRRRFGLKLNDSIDFLVYAYPRHSAAV